MTHPPLRSTSTPAPLAHEILRRTARERPDAPAISWAGRLIDYHTLDTCVDSLAAMLVKRGAGPGRLVGVLANRSPSTVAALLAVLRSGAAYVPVDASYPPARIRYIADDLGDSLACVLHDGTCMDAVPETVARLDLRTVPLSDPVGPVEVTTSPDSLAYVVYTSGSTGAPKGVMIEHRSIAAVVPELVHAYDMGPDDRVLHMAPLGFDTSISEVLRSLWAGACTCIVSNDEIKKPSFLMRLRFLHRERITSAVLPTSLLRSLPRVELPHLRVLVATGEPCTSELVDTWAPGRMLVNAYGSTEATFASTVLRCVPGATGARTPVGRAIATADVFVLDDKGRRTTEPGVTGEICIGGAGLARGYYGRPELTAERFIVVAGRRAFRTGDAGRFDGAGLLECLGRLDNQIKVRGTRVDVDEVEAVVRGCEQIRDAAVTPVPAVAGGWRLVAHVVPQDPLTEQNIPEMVHTHATRRLPAAAVPQFVTVHSELPKTAHGKIDRKLLVSEARARFGLK
jgi:amino acid adenylation domain-containing protein